MSKSIVTAGSIAFIALVALSACSGTIDNTNLGGMPDGSVTGVDASGRSDAASMTMNDASVAVDASTTDATVASDGATGTGDCTAVSDCAGTAAPLCCLDVAFGPGFAPNCAINSTKASCQASCPANIPIVCPSMLKTRLCAAKSDCSEPGYGECCTVVQGAQSVTLCLNKLASSFPGIACK
jgi:hypothetical protein